MTAAPTLNYFQTNNGHGFAIQDPLSAVLALEIGKDANYAKISRQANALVASGLFSQEQYSELMANLRDKGIGFSAANDNPKSWVDRISAENHTDRSR
ncbi:MAG: hypothetical protein U1E36_04465 [Rickettsiales bacterium]